MGLWARLKRVADLSEHVDKILEHLKHEEKDKSMFIIDVGDMDKKTAFELIEKFRDIENLKKLDELSNLFKPVDIIVNDTKHLHKGSDEASGLDIRSSEKVTIKAGEVVLVRSDLRVQLPSGIYADIRPRSGMSLNGYLTILGLIDPDFTGVYGAIIYNTTKKRVTINIGDRIGQVIFKRELNVNLIKGEITKKTERGEKGFGSSGK